MKARIYFFYTLTLFIFTSLLSCVVMDVTNDIGNVNFSLTKGTKNLALTDALVYDTNVYVLTMENTNFQVNDNYKVSYSPMDALKIVANTSNTVSFQVVNVGSGSLTISATHSNDITFSGSVVFNLAKASYSASQIPIAYSPTNTISTSGTYSIFPTVNKMDAFFPKYPLSVKVSPTLPISISDDGRVSLTTGASVSTNKVTVTFSSSNHVDYSNTFYVRLKDALVPQAVFTSTPSSPLTFGVGNNYTVRATLTNSDGSRVAGIAEDFKFTATPPEAIVGISSNANSYTFAVTNASYGNVRIAAVHKQSNTLSVGQSFTLAKGSYSASQIPIVFSATNNVAASSSTLSVSPSSDSRANYYPQGDLTLSKVSGPDTYSFNASSGEITLTGAGSYEFQVKFISSNYTDYTTSSFKVTVEQLAHFARVVLSGSIPNLASGTDEFTRTVLSPLGVATGRTLAARYATESGAGLQNGTSWANAWAATDLRGGINGISDASTTKAYVVLVASGTYKPVDATTTVTTAQRGISFTMKNRVAIIGGFTASGGWEFDGTTTFSGDIGTERSTTDNSYRVFSHTSTLLDNGLLYGVTIAKANANGAASQNSGGGMYNSGSSPRLVNVRFADNSADGEGGGMFNVNNSFPRLMEVVFLNNSAKNNGGGVLNKSSSPRLVDVVFDGNSASGNGGGMYNEIGSSPVLTGVEFTGNSASVDGGGIYNSASSPILTGVVFDGNSASASGGGVYNLDSSMVLTGVVFSNNSSTGISDSVTTRGGGGMYNGNSSPVLKGVVFDGNSANGEGGGMFNVNQSSPVLVGTVFRGNSARNNGGGLYSYNIPSGDGPVVVNSIFTANSVTTGVGADIALDRNGSGNNINVRVAGSVLGVGTANATNGIVVTGTGGTVGSYNITHHSLANGAVNFGANATTSAATGGLTYPTIQSTSSALNIGLHVRKSGTTYYFSEDGTTWYTALTATGGLDSNSTATLPNSTEDLTATDIAGNARNGRPDAGVHEYTP